jgi:hypothetical protein
VSFSPTPGGTGVRKVAGGAETSTASTIVDADVAAGAAIAVSKLAPSATNGQVLTTTAGVTGWAAAAGGGASAGATAGQVQTGNGAGGFTAPTNVLAGSGFVSVGATPATTGTLRLANGSDIRMRDVGNTNDRVMMMMDSGNQMYIGTDPGFTTTLPGTLRIAAGSPITIGTTIFQNLVINGGSLASLNPIYGNGSPFSVHGKTTVATAPPFTLAAADFILDAIMLSNAGAGIVTFPAVSVDSGAYYKTVINTGAGTKTLSNGGASTPTLATNLTGRYLFDVAGVHLTGPTVAYP